MRHTINKHLKLPARAEKLRVGGMGRRLVLVLFVLIPTLLTAQNNIYKIDDELHEMYQRGFHERSNTKSLAIADSMIALSIAKGDKKAECIAYTLPMQHYYQTDEIPQLKKAVDNLKHISRKNGYPQYYYHASNIYITRMLNDGETLTALQENVEMQKEAFEKQEHFGILSCIKNMARIQAARGNQDMAYKYWKEALDYQLQYVNDQDPTLLYMELADYARYKSYYKEALEYNKCGMASAHSKYTRVRLAMQKCHIYFSIGDNDGFAKCYKEALEMDRSVGLDDTDLRYVTARLCNCILNNDMEGALEYSEKVGRKEMRSMWKSVIYEKFGHYYEALHYLRESRTMYDSVNNTVQASDIAQLNTQIGNRLLEAELQRKERVAIELQLRQTQQKVEMEKQKTANEHLKLANQELELNRLKSDKLLLDTENDRQRIAMERQLGEARYQRQMMTFAAITAFIVLMGLLIALGRHRYMLSELNKKNAELEIARDQADSANRMKSTFIQNMSHEIRTPLNSIVGFSQILTTPGMDVTPEEAADYGRIIQHNSELLTTLVNDLLGLAELESDKYTITREAVNCNDMCREVLSSVMYRKSERVDLRYNSDVDDNFVFNTDARRVKQVLINYLTNAEKHTSDGFIELGCSVNANPGKVTFSVTDTGCGVHPDNVDKVFERFEKLNTFETGFGLGLSICRAIADRMNGSVHLDTTYTDGARFLFIIPLEKSA